MLTATLLRQPSDDQGTYGHLIFPEFRCYTIELPWLDNKPQVSCIPTGTYKVIWSLSPRLKKYTYEILQVPNRGGIRIHGGNIAGNEAKGFPSHSLGCPLVGSILGSIKGQKAVLNSQGTLKKLQAYLNKQPFILEVKNA